MTNSSDRAESSQKLAGWERHLQSALLTIVTLALSFTGKFMWDVNSQLREIVTENRHLNLTVARLEGTITAFQSNYVTRNEFAPYQERIRNLEEMRKSSR